MNKTYKDIVGNTMSLLIVTVSTKVFLPHELHAPVSNAVLRTFIKYLRQNISSWEISKTMCVLCYLVGEQEKQ